MQGLPTLPGELRQVPKFRLYPLVPVHILKGGASPLPPGQVFQGLSLHEATALRDGARWDSLGETQ